MANLIIPDSLAKRLQKASAAERKSPESIAKEAVSRHLDYLEWRRQAIDEGFASGKALGWSSTEAMLERFARKRTAIARRKAKVA